MPTPAPGGDLPRLLRVRDVMDSDPLVFPTDTPLLEGVGQMLWRRVSVAFVLDADGLLLGQVTDGDCLRVLAGSAFEHHSATGAYDEVALGSRVDAMMNPVPATVTPDQDLFGAAQRFLESGEAVLPVVEQHRLIGILRRLDLLDSLGRTVQDMAAERGRFEDEAKTASERPASIERLQRAFSRLAPDQLVRLMGRIRQDR